MTADHETRVSAGTALRFRYHCWRRDISNFSLLHRRGFAGFFVSMHQGGTHWLKHMLATAITHKFGLPPPRYSHANDVIGGVRDPRIYRQIPYLVSSHSIPHPLVSSRAWRRVMNFPPYVVLVRDIRATLVANYEKWKAHYACDFSEFVRGDVAGRRFDTDIWWCLRFCNAWGRIARRFPAATLVLRYEDIAADPALQLDRINRFLNLGLDRASIDHGTDESTREKMARKADPGEPRGLVVVRNDPRPPQEWFTATDRAYFLDVCRRMLRYNFGYDYENWDMPGGTG